MRANRLALAAVALWCRGVSAQPSTLFGDGKQLLQDGKPAEACVKFEAALREQPEAPGILLNLGLCNAQQNKTATALKWFRKAQTSAAEHQMAETESAAKLQTVTLAAKVPTIKIEIAEPAPHDASVTVDGTTVDSTSLARLEIDPGRHLVELRGSGLTTVRETIDVADDATSTKVVTLHAVAVARPRPDLPKTIVVEIDRGRSRRRWSYLAGGTGVGLLLAETGLGLAGKQRFDDARDLDTRQRWKTIVRYGGSTMFGLGVIAVGTAIVLYLGAPGKERVEKTVIAPTAGGGHLGLAITGAF